MGFKVKQTGGKDYGPPEAGAFQAICYATAGLGTHTGTFGPKEQCVLIFEIPEQKILVPKDGVEIELPRAISKTYTASLHEKSNLYGDLVSWRGKAFSPYELEGFDLANVSGVNCYINIVHEIKGDKTYANIAAIMPLPKGMPKLTPINPIVNYDIACDDFRDIPAGLPEWVTKKIQDSAEFKPTGDPFDQPTGGQANPDWNEEGTPPTDDIPF